MSFSFGASAQPQSNLFGSTSTAPKPATTFGSFGTPQQNTTPAQPSTSLFGTPNANNPTPQTASLFGAQSTSNTQPQPSGTGGLFGSNANANANMNTNTGTVGGLFGSTNQSGQTGSLFGQPQPQSQTQTQNQNQNQTGTGFGGSLFGSNNNANTGVGTQKPGGVSLFGQPQTQQQSTSGGLFGSNQSSQPTQGGGLFGSTTTQQQPGGTSNLFGQNSISKPTAGLFGSLNQSTQQNQPSQQSGLFSFGNSSTSQLQQQQQQQPQQNQLPSLFASTSAPLGSSTLGNSTFGQSTNNAFGGMGVSVVGMTQKQEPDIESRMMNVYKAWDTNSPECRFKYFFYNVVDAGTTGQYGRPAGATDDTKWSKAVRENPDPTSMVPVLATGWADVKKRVQLQENVASVHQQRIKELSQALDHLTRQSSLSSSIRLTALQTHLNQLLHRLIHLAALTPQLIPLLQSTSFRQEEAETRQQLDHVKSELEGKTRSSTGRVGASAIGTPRSGHTGKGRMIGQVNELWGQVEEIRRSRKGRNAEGRDGWLSDEKALAEVADILATQQLALQKLTDLLNNALFDAEVMKQGLGGIGNS